ncbi:MAG: hypothetical protein M5U28_11350 [Sandaracinaceae bacterium]|nr:hypothetical protein [Sandaracinaceae bacterium]
MGSSVIFAVALVFAVLFLLEWTLGRLDPYAHARWAFIPLLTERIEVSDAMRSSLRASGALTGDDLRDDRMPWPRAFEDGGRRWEPPVADHHGFLRVKWFPSALVRSPPAGTVRVSARLRGERLVVRAAYLPRWRVRLAPPLRGAPDRRGCREGRAGRDLRGAGVRAGALRRQRCQCVPGPARGARTGPPDGRRPAPGWRLSAEPPQPDQSPRALGAQQHLAAQRRVDDGDDALSVLRQAPRER